MAEPNQSGQDRHHALIAETQSCGVQTVIVAGRSGHLAKGGHIGGGLSVCGFSVAQTLVGGFANCPQGIPVLRADTTPDSEITVLQITVSVRSARPSLKYCLSRED